MAIVINGSGTITGLSAGGLPTGSVTADTLATDSVDSAELIDGAIDDSHLASGTIAYTKSLRTDVPCFFAYNSTQDTNQTGNGTEVTVDFDAEVFDQGANFASDTFTAPVTGKYLLTANIDVNEIGTATSYTMTIATSNRDYRFRKTFTADSALTAARETIVVIADMDVDDTATAKCQYSGMAGDTGDINGAGTLYTFFSGVLVA